MSERFFALRAHSKRDACAPVKDITFFIALFFNGNRITLSSLKWQHQLKRATPFFVLNLSLMMKRLITESLCLTQCPMTK
jgi:hypothetical protein